MKYTSLLCLLLYSIIFILTLNPKYMLRFSKTKNKKIVRRVKGKSSLGIFIRIFMMNFCDFCRYIDTVWSVHARISIFALTRYMCDLTSRKRESSRTLCITGEKYYILSFEYVFRNNVHAFFERRLTKLGFCAFAKLILPLLKDFELEKKIFLCCYVDENKLCSRVSFNTQ